jgi:hypothetical protein
VRFLSPPRGPLSAGQAHQRYIAHAASLPDGGIKDGDYGKRDGEQKINHGVSRIAIWSAVALGAGSCDILGFAPDPPPASERLERLHG